MNETMPRRVGSFSAGVFLILFGLGIFICMFLPEPWRALSFLARFAPLLLILLGAELLYSHLRAKTGSIRFDGFSVFFCIVALLFGLGMSLASLGVQSLNAAWQNQRYQDVLDAEAQTVASGVLQDETDITRLSAHFNLNGKWKEAPTLQTALQQAPHHISVTLNGDYADETAFAARCQTLFKPLWEKGFRRVTFYTEPFPDNHYAHSYELTLDSAFALTASPQALGELSAVYGEHEY